MTDTMGPTPYPGGGPIEAFANTNSAQPANLTYSKIESIGDLVSPASLNFEYSPDLNAVMHVGKCAECVRFGLHILTHGKSC